jgi:serine phosphatase RsbU (regulator of sigma subunit)
MKYIKRVTLLLSVIVFGIIAKSQGFDNATRALYILDISKYVKWNDDNFQKLPEFTIGVLSNETDFYWELSNAAKTRQFIQQKPIRVIYSRNIDNLAETQVLYVKDKKEFPADDILKKIKGKHTLLITENFEFRHSMINFVAIGGKPKFEANEKLMNEEGMSVSQLFLAQAVKTREEWELLFQKTEVELGKEKETVKKQDIIIVDQTKKIDTLAAQIEVQEHKLIMLNTDIADKQKTLNENIFRLNQQESFITGQKNVINNQLADIHNKKTILEGQELKIDVKNKEIAEKDKKISKQTGILADQLKVIEKQKIVLFFSFLIAIALAALGYFIFRSYQIKKQANIRLEEKNRMILAQKAEIEEQRDIARLQRDQIAYQKRHITDSIEYAKRIQRAVLPALELFTEVIEHFVLYKPKDIVSGDFYWVSKTSDDMIVVVADCTGHGVPGAFMSMLGVSLLNEIVNNRNIRRPDEILNTLRSEVISHLKQKERADLNIKDGMDITICNINFKTNTLTYAGANNPLYFVRDNNLTVIKGNKMPVAIYAIMEPFALNEMKLEKGDVFYTFSDGFVDQFGGENNKKFLSAKFRDTLLQISSLPMLQQGTKLNDIFETWRGEMEQLDDVTIIGIRY